MLTEGTLPKPCLIVADCLVIALTLGTPVGNAGDIADDKLSCRKGEVDREGRKRMGNRLKELEG